MTRGSRWSLGVTLAIGLLLIRPYGAEAVGHGWRLAGSIPGMVTGAGVASDGHRLIYLVGGVGRSSGPLASAETYDIVTHQWQTLPRMGTRRYRPAAFVGRDGRLYVFGGNDTQGTAYASGTVYDPGHRRWSMLPAAPHPHDDASARCPDGRFVLVGDSNGADSDVKYVDEYDPATRRWTAYGTVPRAGTDLNLGGGTDLAVACGPSSTLYVVGGASINGSTQYHRLAMLDMTHRRWRLGTRLSYAVGGAAAVFTPTGHLYVMGGGHFDVTTESQVTYRTTSIYDVRRGRWTAGPSLTHPRYLARAVLSGDGALYVFGGESGATQTFEILTHAS